MQRSTHDPEVWKRGAAAKWVDPADLVPWSRNPRKNDHAVEGVANSILRFGFGAPIVARKENNEIIAGHTRHKAALLIGYSPVRVCFLDLTEEQAHAYAIADNNLNESAMWDYPELDKLLDELDEELSGIYDHGDDEQYDEEDQPKDDIKTDDPEENKTLLDKLNDLVARSEQKMRQKKVWGKADHKALLSVSDELKVIIS